MKTIKGNISKDFYLARPEDLAFVWVELQRRIHSPDQNKMVNERLIRSFSVDAWNNKPRNWVTASGYHSFLLLHLPGK